MLVPRSTPLGAAVCTAALLCVLPGHASGEASVEAAALIVTATGPLTVSGDGRGSRAAGALDWLVQGAVVEAASGASAVIALASGRRFELTPSSRVRVSTDRLEVLAGRARELERVAPLPRLSLLSADAAAGSRAGALRVRGRRLTGLYPRADAVTLAARTTLSFAPQPGIGDYSVEVEEEDGTTVLKVTTRGSVVPVSPGVLHPGRRYRWLVRGDSLEGIARGDAQFLTLDAEGSEARERLLASVGSAPDVASLTLLAEVDRSLGLLREAHDGFSRALAAAPEDARLRQAIEQLEARLREPAPAERGGGSQRQSP